MLKKFRKVEFGGEIGVILQQSRVLLHDLQYTVQFVLTATRAHAQCVLVHNNGQRRRVQKSDAGADEKPNSGLSLSHVVAHLRIYIYVYIVLWMHSGART